MIMNSIPKQGKTEIMKITNIPKTTKKIKENDCCYGK
jgi:hypothetical protein